MADPFKLLVLPGDGIGPDVVAAALRVFERLCRQEQIANEVQHDLLHGAAWDKYGTFCRDETVVTAQQSNALLIGAVGGPQWDEIVIEGRPQLHGARHRVIPDRVEAGTYLVAGALAGDEVEIRRERACSVQVDLDRPTRRGIVRYEPLDAAPKGVAGVPPRERTGDAHRDQVFADDPETFRSILRLRGVEAHSPSGYAEAFYARKMLLFGCKTAGDD